MRIKLTKNNNIYVDESKSVIIRYKKSTKYYNYTLTIEMLGIEEGFNTLKEAKDFLNSIEGLEEKLENYKNVKDFLERNEIYYATRELKAILNHKDVLQTKIWDLIKYGKTQKAKKMIDFFNITNLDFLEKEVNEVIEMNEKDIKKLNNSNYQKSNIYNLISNVKIEELEKLYIQVIEEIEKDNFEGIKEKLINAGMSEKNITIERFENTINSIKDSFNKYKRAKKIENKKQHIIKSINNLGLFIEIYEVEKIKELYNKDEEKFFERVELRKKSYANEIKTYRNILKDFQEVTK